MREPEMQEPNLEQESAGDDEGKSGASETERAGSSDGQDFNVMP